MVARGVPAAPLGDVDVHDVASIEVGDRFRVFVGRCGDAPAVALVVTDANGLFGLTVDTVRMMQLVDLVPSMVVVGIGYPWARSIADTVDIRSRDLTPTASHRFPASGGADAFLRFVTGPVLDLVTSGTETVIERTVYFGHSLGGLLGLYALLQPSRPFDDFIISSPSLWWDDRVLFEHERRRAELADGMPARVFVGIGAEETDSGRRRETERLPAGHPHKAADTYLDMVDDVARFAGALSSRSHAGLDLAVEVLPGEFHATVPGSVLTRGLRHVFAVR
jgi:hypothetical protein